jgi:hypothetical protein
MWLCPELFAIFSRSHAFAILVPSEQLHWSERAYADLQPSSSGVEHHDDGSIDRNMFLRIPR